MIIDNHTHIFPEHVVERAMATLTERYEIRPVALATPSGLLAHMDECGVDRSVVVAVTTKPDQCRSVNKWFASLAGERLIPFGSIHPHLEDLEDEVERVVGSGMPGLKVHAHFQGFALDDPRFLRMLELIDNRLVLLFHAGDEIAPMDRVETTPARLLRLHEQFPEQRMILAHMGAYDQWDEAEEHLVGRDIYLDASYTFDLCPDERIERMMRAHGLEKVVWGSDFPWQSQCQCMAGMERLGLSDEEKQAVYSRNFMRLLNGR